MEAHPVPEHLHAAQFDPARHAERLKLRDWQRERMAKIGSSRQGEFRDVKGDMDPNPIPGGRRPQIPVGPFDAGAMRRLGTVEDVSLGMGGQHSFTSRQRTVNFRRIRELMHDPSKGMNPRIPDDHPVAVRQQDGTHAIVQGNHRINAAIMSGQSSMPVRVIPATTETAIRYKDYLDERKVQKKAAFKKKLTRRLSGAATEAGMSTSRLDELMKGFLGE